MVLLMVACALSPAAWGSPSSLTTIAVNSAAGPATSVVANTVITLTATVTSAGAAVTTGQVAFCDASATYCEDVHILGTAQLTSMGTAALNFIPGIGSHSYKAVFAGTTAVARSSSAASTLAVTGSQPTMTTIAQSGVPGNYSLTATVTGGQEVGPPTGNILFLDTSAGNAELGSAALENDAPSLGWISSASPDDNFYGEIVAADFNGDGKLDYVVQGPNSDGIEILLGNGDGTFTVAQGNPLTATTNRYSVVNSVAVGDVNGDGKADIIVGIEDLSAFSSALILLGNGDGTFTSAASGSVFSDDGSALFSGAGDFNGDGNLDLLSFDAGGVNVMKVYFGKGDGTFTGATSSTSIPAFSSIGAFGDFNGDGKQDVVLTTPGNTGALLVLLGNGDGTFAQTASIPDGPFGGASATIADFNGDGKEDIAVGNVYANNIVVWLGNGDGTFTEAAQNNPSVDYPEFMATGDFNADGKADLVIGGLNPPLTLTVLLGNGDGTFTNSAAIQALSDQVHGLVVGDFNGDGLPDILATTSYGNESQLVSTQLTHSVSGTVVGISPVGSGTHLIEANYAGDSGYSGSHSATTSLSGTRPTITLSPSMLPGGVVGTAYSQAITAAGGTAPYGYKIMSGTLPAGLNLSTGGVLSGTPTNSGAFSFAVTATDSSGGGGPYSASVKYSVTVAPAPDFSFTGTSTSLMITAGQSASLTLTVTPIGGFNSTVSLSCGTLPAETTCSFASQQLMTASGATMTTASLTTTAPGSAFNPRPAGPAAFDKSTGSKILLVALALFFVPRRPRGKLWLSLALTAILASGLSGCGGSGSKGGGNPGTPAGTYTVVITGTGGTGAGAISHKVTTNLIVQ